jgi:HAD superfamily hydrolase (TIGR01490 family)
VNDAAFFDLDKTLIPGSSLYLLAVGLRRRGMVPARDIAKFAWRQGMFRALGAERKRGMDTAHDAALAFVRGRSRDELKALARDITDQQILPTVYPEMERLIFRHRACGRETYLVTAAPMEMAELVAEALGMKGAVGTIAEVDDTGCYTGRLEGPLVHGHDKAAAVEAFALSAHLDLASSFVYSDSINDRALLERAGHPHAVNPDRRLRKVANRQGWPIVDLRRGRRAVLIGLLPLAGGVAAAAGRVAFGRLRSRGPLLGGAR